MISKLLIVLIILVSIGFCAVAQMRGLVYAKKYKLPESKYTLLFGFISIRYLSVFYAVVMLAHTLVCLWIAFNYL